MRYKRYKRYKVSLVGFDDLDVRQRKHGVQQVVIHHLQRLSWELKTALLLFIAGILVLVTHFL